MIENQNIAAAPNAIGALVAALAAALPEIEGVSKNKSNPAFKSKYADLGACISALHPIVKHGLWYRQISHPHDGGVEIETFYIHSSGAELSAGRVFVPADKANAHGFGSAQSYARRYALQTAFGLATEDDDGNAASKAPPAQKAADPNAPPKTHLDAAEKRMVRQIESCGDADMLDAYTKTDEAKADYNLLNRFRPEAIHGPAPEGLDGYIPIADRIKAKRDAFQIAALATA